MSVTPRVHLLTLGCPMNEADSSHMMAAIDHAGFAVADDPETADVVVVNTCAFIEDAVEESIEVVMELARDWKVPRSTLRRALERARRVQPKPR